MRGCREPFVVSAMPSLTIFIATHLFYFFYNRTSRLLILQHLLETASSALCGRLYSISVHRMYVEAHTES